MATNRITRAKVLETLLNRINTYQRDRAIEADRGDFQKANLYTNMAAALYNVLVDLDFEDGVDFERKFAKADGIEYVKRVPIKGGRK